MAHITSPAEVNLVAVAHSPDQAKTTAMAIVDTNPEIVCFEAVLPDEHRPTYTLFCNITAQDRKMYYTDDSEGNLDYANADWLKESVRWIAGRMQRPPSIKLIDGPQNENLRHRMEIGKKWNALINQSRLDEAYELSDALGEATHITHTEREQRMGSQIITMANSRVNEGRRITAACGSEHGEPIAEILRAAGIPVAVNNLSYPSPISSLRHLHTLSPEARITAIQRAAIERIGQVTLAGAMGRHTSSPFRKAAAMAEALPAEVVSDFLGGLVEQKVAQGGKLSLADLQQQFANQVLSLLNKGGLDPS